VRDEERVFRLTPHPYASPINYSITLATTPAPTVRPAFADGEAQTFFHGDRLNQRYRDGDVVRRA